MKAALALIFACVAMVACASVSDVVSTGPDAYMVAAGGVVGASSSGPQLAKAQKEAADFCKKQGKQVETISSNEVLCAYGSAASATVNFKCIKL